jgi:nitrogen-specific signal transduction histidine kinase
MSADKLATLFAPPERASDDDIKGLFSQIKDIPFIAKLIDSVPGGMLVLNQNRQIIFANRSVLNMAGQADLTPVLGKRPGEALQCINSTAMPAGCGTSEFCRTCGVVNAILTSQEGKPDVQECRIIRKPDGDALDLRVWVTPFRLGGMMLTIFAMMDISDEKRRKALERIFFHDILNTASGIKGFAELLKEANPGEAKQYQGTIFSLARMIVDEINSQRQLTAAENNELSIKPVQVRSLDLLREIVDLYKNHDVARDRTVRVDANAQDVTMTTDRTLLQRVIGNMTKNAIEACRPGETVTLGCVTQMKQVQFWVHNPNEMPREIQLQVFQRSFSTKGVGRGLGTYSIKMLSERYLKGAASFVSGKDGTIFRVSYPLSISAT